MCKAIESIRMLVNVLAIGFYCTLSYGMVHWPLMGGLLHLVLVGSFGIHADYVYLRGLTLCTQHAERCGYETKNG